MRYSAIVLMACLAVPVGAQTPVPPTENVTVTGTRSREVLDKFVNSLATPSRMTGKIARWEDGVCPVTVGLKQKFIGFISQRVRTLAKDVGAPVNADKDCKPNIEIVFTTTPQALIDNVKAKDEVFLGFADNKAQRQQLATITRPIQAWYTTATRDLSGRVEVDSSKMTGLTMDMPVSAGGCTPDGCPPGQTVTLNLTSAHPMMVTGSRLGDGLRSDFYHVIIVAEPAKLLDEEIGTLADYIALLSLTQLNSLDTCQPLPSIANMLAKDCAPVKALTDNDLAYLKGLYRMGLDRNDRVQRDQIGYDMQQSLDGQ